MSEYAAKIDIDRQLRYTEITVYNSDVDYLRDSNMEDPKNHIFRIRLHLVPVQI